MKFEKIYIFCPTDVVSGGVNSLQILCNALVNNNIDAKIYYIKPDEEFINHAVIRSFNTPYTTHIDDSDENLLIVPEAYIPVLHQYASIRKMIYWLGIYFYIKKPPHRFPLSIKIVRKIFAGYSFFGNPANGFHALTQRVNLWSKKKDPVWSSAIIHMTNSFYAADFLKHMGINDAIVLHNPVREEFYLQKTKPVKEKKILFGPGTPNRLIRKIRKSFPDYECIRLRHIHPDDVHRLYTESMLFIELGDFAGRNRMPREAVLSGCVVITSRTGSAHYHSDLPLPDYYKINTGRVYLPELINKIYAVVNDYPLHYSNMHHYMESLINEKNNFRTEVASVFENLQKKD